MTSPLLLLSLLSGACLSGCGIGFQIAGQDKDGEDAAAEAKQKITAPPRPLVVTTPEDQHAFNDLAASDVSMLEGAFDFQVDQTTEVKLWIVKYKPMKCGDIDSVAPEFRWVEILPDGTMGSGQIVEPQQAFTIAAGTTRRLHVKMEASFGYCEQMHLRFEAHTRGF